MAATEQFEDWLSDKLKKLNTDQEVFGTYIKSILEGNESEEEKRESLEGILSEVVDTSDISTICDEIFMHWLPSKKIIDTCSSPKSVDAKIASIMEEQAKSVVSHRKITTEDKQLREAILANYSEVCEGEEYDDEEEEFRNKDSGAAANVLPSEPSITKNTNAENVMQAEREKREKSKAENEKKKAQDKLNKEKQKQQQQQRKEKEKKRTQKQERKR